MKSVIGEEIRNSYTIIIFGIPKETSDYLRVCPIQFTVVDGTIYYNDNTAEALDYRTMTKEAMSKAAQVMGITEADNYKIDYISGYGHYCDEFGGDSRKENEKIISKLQTMTGIDYYRKGVKC